MTKVPDTGTCANGAAFFYYSGIVFEIFDGLFVY
jgi:hypothetical protein